MEKILTLKKVLRLIALAKKVYILDEVKDYILKIVEKIRMRGEIQTGPSPRASIWIFKGSRVKALLEGRNYVIPDDIKYIAPYALHHRVRMTPETDYSETSIQSIIEDVLKNTAVPKV